MEKIKISHINPTDIRGGASLAGYRLHKEFLKEPDIDSVLFVNKKYSNNREVIQFSSCFSRFLEKILNKIGQFTGILYFFSVNWIKLLYLKRFWQTDIFITRMIHGGYLPFWMPWLLSKIAPVIWRMPDMWAFTSRCPYSYNCSKKEYPGVFIKSDKIIFKLKKFFYSRSNIYVVCPSKWLEQEARKSGFFKESKIFYIPTGVDEKVFHPAEKFNKPSALAVSIEISDKRKGGEIFPKILVKLNEKLKEKNIFIDFYWVGNNRNSEISKYSNINNIFLNYLEEKELAEHYSRCHIYVLPTLADNLPNTLLESMSSGTPAACFDIGGCGDIVKQGETGYLAKPFDAEDFARGILKVLENYEGMGRRSRELVLNGFTMEQQKEKYLELMKNIIHNQ